MYIELVQKERPEPFVIYSCYLEFTCCIFFFLLICISGKTRVV